MPRMLATIMFTTHLGSLQKLLGATAQQYYYLLTYCTSNRCSLWNGAFLYYFHIQCCPKVSSLLRARIESAIVEDRAPMQCWATRRQAFPYGQHCMGGGGEVGFGPKNVCFHVKN